MKKKKQPQELTPHDFHTEKRQYEICHRQIDIILDNQEIPGKLLETLGFREVLK